ncbi:MAG: hypothetical protein MJB14_20325, partial [Spirochaetes bacterium]|nr:hypothetical protein [Spirochaetota bacterium]
MKKVLIFFAHKKEANALINQSTYAFKKINSHTFYYSTAKKQILVFITGIGKERVLSSLHHLLHHQQSPEMIEFMSDFNHLVTEKPLLPSDDQERWIIKAGTCAVIDQSKNILEPY